MDVACFRDCVLWIISNRIRSVAEMFLECVVKMLRCGIAKILRNFGSSLFGIGKVLMGQVEALLCKVAEDGCLENFFEAPLQLVFVEADCFCDLRQVWRAMEAAVDQIAHGQNLLLVCFIFYKQIFAPRMS